MEPNYKELWGYKCPECRNDFSIEDERCYSCGLIFKEYLKKKTISGLKKYLNKTPYFIVQWSIYESLIILSLYLITTLILPLLLTRSIENYNIQQLITIIAGNLILFFSPLVILKKKYRIGVDNAGINLTHLKRDIQKGFRYSIFFIIILLLYFKFLSLSGQIVYKNISIIDWIFTSESLASQLILLFLMVVVIPVSSEIFYRGFFYKSIRTKFTFIQSSILISLVFAALYLDLRIFFLSFIISFNSCYLFEKYKTIIPSILLNCLINLTICISAFSQCRIISLIPWDIIVGFMVFISACAIFLTGKPMNKIRSIFLLPYNIILINLTVLILLISFVINSDALINNREFAIIKSLFYINNGKFTNAETLLNTLLKREGDSPEVLSILQTLFYYEGRHIKAVEISKKIKKIKKKFDINDINSIALSKAELGEDFSEEIKIIENFLQKSKDTNYSLQETLGWLYYKSGRIHLGHTLIIDSLNSMPVATKLSFSESFYHLGKIYLTAGNVEKAYYYFNKSAELSPSCYFGKLSLKEVRVLTGQINI